MKTTFENSALVKYCLSKPFTSILMITVLLTSIIIVDQTLNGMQSSGNNFLLFNHMNAFTGHYIAYSNPELISYFKDAHQPSTGASYDGYTISFNNACENVQNVIEFQIRLIRKLAQLIR